MFVKYRTYHVWLMTQVTVNSGLKMLSELSDVDTVYVVIEWPFFSPPPPAWQEVGLQTPQYVPQSHKATL